MTDARPNPAMLRANRRLTAVLALLGLFLQAIAPYLPMPAMGGATSWDLAEESMSAGGLAWLPSCLSPRSGAADDGSGERAPHWGDCTACLVMQQAGSTLAPDLPELPRPVAVLRLPSPPWQQAQGTAPALEAFSSRAPPRRA